MKGIFIIGEICSGKSTFYKKFYDNLPYIELGDIVRQIKKTDERIFDNSLDSELYDEVIKKIQKLHCDKVVIIGVRQISLLTTLSSIFDENIYIFLHTPRKILKERFYKRASIKDADINFENAILKDEKLGIEKLKLFLLNETNCSFIKTL